MSPRRAALLVWIRPRQLALTRLLSPFNPGCVCCTSEPRNGRAAAVTEPSVAGWERMFLPLSVPSEPEHNSRPAAHPWFSRAAAGSIPTSKLCGDNRLL